MQTPRMGDPSHTNKKRLARVKNVMRSLENTGQLYNESTELMSFAMESFVEDIVSRTAEHGKRNGKKRVNVADLRTIIANEDKFDFLRTVQIPDAENRAPSKRPKRRKHDVKISESAERAIDALDEYVQEEIKKPNDSHSFPIPLNLTQKYSQVATAMKTKIGNDEATLCENRTALEEDTISPSKKQHMQAPMSDSDDYD